MFEFLDDVPYTNGGSMMCEVACWVGICACDLLVDIMDFLSW
jgi:hypothetical protein